ncbi:MAG: hypothetical protein ABIL58_17775 [Pseudomonadota bacterium]
MKKLNPDFITQTRFGKICPYCGEQDPEFTHFEDLEDGTIFITFWCAACNENFDEIYCKKFVIQDYMDGQSTAVRFPFDC